MMFSALKLFLFICRLLGNLFIFIWEVSIVDIFCCVFVYTFFLFLFFVLYVFFVLSDDVRSLLQIEDDVVLSSESLLHSNNQEFVLLLGETS